MVSLDNCRAGWELCHHISRMCFNNGEEQERADIHSRSCCSLGTCSNGHDLYSWTHLWCPF
ncbi:hypothetical protein LINPERPRIM_LOCUS586 [Linum perenne]